MLRKPGLMDADKMAFSYHSHIILASGYLVPQLRHNVEASVCCIDVCDDHWVRREGHGVSKLWKSLRLISLDV